MQGIQVKIKTVDKYGNVIPIQDRKCIVEQRGRCTHNGDDMYCITHCMVLRGDPKLPLRYQSRG
jgi:hypothetical protein